MIAAVLADGASVWLAVGGATAAALAAAWRSYGAEKES